MKHKKVTVDKPQPTNGYQPPQRITIKSDDTTIEFQHMRGEMYVYKHITRLSPTGRRSTKYGLELPLTRKDIDRLVLQNQ